MSKVTLAAIVTNGAERGQQIPEVLGEKKAVWVLICRTSVVYVYGIGSIHVQLRSMVKRDTQESSTQRAA